VRRRHSQSGSESSSFRNQSRFHGSFHRLIWTGLSTVFLILCLESCNNSSVEPVTITLLDPGWPDKEFSDWRDHEVADFTGETGIQVKLLPAPETALDQLTLWRKLLDSGLDAPDVYAIDIIWPALLAEQFIDLKPYLAQDTGADFPWLVSNDTVNGKLIAVPYHADAGLLFYRTDLLREYGYPAPPVTWDELEKMAARIQVGERSKGKKDFWGFVWQGAAAEGLTCNALEWQASEGGGHIIEDDGSISVNNPQTIRAWDRATRWVGSISPPGVVAYREWDALNVWRSGNAAFMRNWPTSFVVSRSEGSSVRTEFAVSLLPKGQVEHVGTLGGASLSVSRHSRHPKEAVALVRYLCRRNVQLARSRATSQPPTIPELYEDAEALKANPHFAQLEQLFHEGVVARPSTVTGKKYTEVSEAYFHAVHSALTREKSAAKSAADLEGQLVQITGMKVRVPAKAVAPASSTPEAH
jgi:trehalose/maltose transport system substrate-binding protein